MSGGFNPRWLRAEFGACLCPCSCHSSCPVTPATRRMPVSAKTWYTSCTCAGAEQARRRMDETGVEFPDSGELWEKARRHNQARSEAFRAARARAAGLSREDVREIYIA